MEKEVRQSSTKNFPVNRRDQLLAVQQRGEKKEQININNNAVLLLQLAAAEELILDQSSALAEATATIADLRVRLLAAAPEEAAAATVAAAATTSSHLDQAVTSSEATIRDFALTVSAMFLQQKRSMSVAGCLSAMPDTHLDMAMQTAQHHRQQLPAKEQRQSAGPGAEEDEFFTPPWPSADNDFLLASVHANQVRTWLSNSQDVTQLVGRLRCSTKPELEHALAALLLLLRRS